MAFGLQAHAHDAVEGESQEADQRMRADALGQAVVNWRDFDVVERRRLSEPILDALFRKLQFLREQCMANSSLGEAISYTMNLRQGLGIFLTDGRVEVDNNPVENTIRPLALLRKNALFAGSEFGGEMMAVTSSLIATCKMNGVEPHAYFTWVFDKVAKKLPMAEYHTLLLWNCPVGRTSMVTSDRQRP